MSKTRQSPPVVVDDGPNALSITFYVAGDGTPRVTLNLPNYPGTLDHAMSEYSSLTGTQKNNLKTMLIALRDETLTLEGFV